MNNFGMTFFNTGGLAVVLFSLYILFTPHGRYPRWLALPGLLTITFFVIFLILQRTDYSQRADVLLISSVEWFVIVSVCLWLVLTSVHHVWHKDS